MSYHVKLLVQVICYKCNAIGGAAADFRCPTDPDLIHMPDGWTWQRMDIYDQDREPMCKACNEREKAEEEEMNRKVAESAAARRLTRTRKKP